MVELMTRFAADTGVATAGRHLDIFCVTHTYLKGEPGFLGTLSQLGKYPPLHPVITLCPCLILYALRHSLLSPRALHPGVESGHNDTLVVTAKEGTPSGGKLITMG